MLNNTPIRAYCKKQCVVETSTYGSEMVAARVAVEIILEICYALRMLGVPIEKTSLLMGDNNSVLLNTTLPSSMLKKKHLGCSYHRIREAVAAKIIDFAYIPSEHNYADILTKPLPTHAHHRLAKPWLFRRAKVIDKAAGINERKTLMATVIPTDDEQDQTEQQLRIRQYMNVFRRQLHEITQNGRRAELFRLVLQDIRKVNHKITEYDESYKPICWNTEFILQNGQRHCLSPKEAITFNRRVVAWYSNVQG